MTSDGKLSKNGCLADEDLSLYVSGEGNSETLGRMEDHLSQCSSCRRHLAEVLEILHPTNEKEIEEIGEPSGEELDRTIAMIKEVARKESTSNRRVSYRFRWPLAAAAAIVVVALALWGMKSFYEVRKSAYFFSQAATIMDRTYVETSPSNLRLDLPFHSSATKRSLESPESLQQALILFSNALTYRESMVDARLGLAYIYLRESKLDRAREQFQKVLTIKKSNVPALIGRGVVQFEEAVQGADPLKRRPLLERALSDFNEALQLVPDSSEALYNKIRTLFESGLHKEALREIERYLSRDSNSIWAEELKALRVKMRTTQSNTVLENVLRLARERNKDALTELARLAPDHIPAALVYAMRKSIELNQKQGMPDGPNSEDLLWAIGMIEPAYRAETRDVGFRDFLAFHAGLSPPRQELKKTLDSKFKKINTLYRQNRFADVLNGSYPLISQYTKLHDLWQVAYLHHMRGNSYYLGMADLPAAEAEFRKMLSVADRLNASAFKATALASIALTCKEQRKYDDALDYINKSKNLARSHNLKRIELYACMRLGSLFYSLGQFERSFEEFSAVLKTAYRLLDCLSIVDALEDLGAVSDRLGRVEDARAYYHTALRHEDDFRKSQAVSSIPELSLCRFNLLFDQGELSLRTGDIASAERFFKESLESKLQGMYELEARNRLGLAEVYFRTNRIAETEAEVELVKSLNVSGKYPEIDWQTRLLESRLQERAGHHENALALIEQATDILETMRRHIRSLDSRHSFFEDRFNPFKTMVSMLNRSADGRKKTLEVVDRAKSMSLREYLHIPELTSQFKGDSIRAGQRMSACPILEYFFAVDELLILFTKKDRIEIISQNIPKEEISLQVQEYLDGVRRQDQKDINRAARRLYDELIAPVEGKVFETPSETLMILPDGPLHLLPFAGLQDRQGRFMIEKMPLAYAPSRSLLRHCLISSQKPFHEDLRAMLINGAAGLPSAQKELSYLSKLFGGNATILTSMDLPIFKRAAEASGIVHFSGHAVDKQGKPALLLRAFPNEIYLDSSAIAGWKMPEAYLVNLSGCSTGIGPLTEGASPWGLIPAFLNAGTPAIIASLAPVDDASTERLNCRFYELLKKGIGKAESLQKAQLELLHSTSSDSTLRQQSWIPYVLIGNPQ